jgi:hypothetical protein
MDASWVAKWRGSRIFVLGDIMLDRFVYGQVERRPEAIDAARDTAMNPAVAEAFALAICGADGAPAYPGVPRHEPD